MTANPAVERPGQALLLERERELAALGIAIGEAAAGCARVLAIEGAAGIGKTRLLTEVRGLTVEADLRVLFARGGEVEREFPFGIVRQLFEPVVAGPDGQALLGAAAAARPVFDPTGDDQFGDPSFASLHGLYWLTVNLAGDRPLAII